jgi:hypothetical protein
MASKVVEDIIEDYLTANWVTTPIFTENQQNETPSDGSSFVILQFPLANTERPVFNSRHYREEGIFRLVINVARGQGVDTMRSYGETLATLFRDKELPIGTGTILTGVPDEPYTDRESDSVNYFTGTMVVPFRRLFAG